jgi:peptidoglycan/LPS O-acetylase OafA/YrhL
MQKNRLDFIDFAKGFSIMTILVYHFFSTVPFASIFQQAIMLGGTGVHLFIFLSGFGLALSSKRPVLDFYKRRLLKTLVPYFIFVTIVFLLNFLIKLNSEHSMYAYLGHILLYKMFDNSIVGSYGAQMWFVSLIVQLYLLFPLLQKLLEKVGAKFFIGITLALSVGYWFAISFAGLGSFRVWNSSFLQFLWEFALGMVAATLYKSREFKFWEIKWPTLLVTAVLGIGLMGFLSLKGGTFGKMFNDIPAFFGYTALVVLLYSIGLKIFRHFTSAFIKIGYFSYSLYLTHVFVLQLAGYVAALIVPGFIYNVPFVLMLVPVALLFAWAYEKFTGPLIGRLFAEKRPNGNPPVSAREKG